MTDETFIEILNKPESSILDFKADLYDFTNDKDEVVLAKFTKDVISFTNTIREGPAYIIFGVKETPDNKKEKVGISKNIDDAILQDKIKTKLYPIPKFKYFTKQFDGLLFGILEFPLHRNEFPVTSTVKLKGIEIGKVYYRQGSTNTEALSLDVIKINNWLLSLPQKVFQDSTQSVISDLLKRLLTKRERLSEILPDIYLMAKSANLIELKEFCELEIKGFDVTNEATRKKIQHRDQPYKYRVQTIKVSIDSITYARNSTADQIKSEMNRSSDFYNVPYFFKEPIASIEDYLNQTDGFLSITMKIKDVLPEFKKDYPAYGYIFNSDLVSVYQNIRQRLIDLTMDLK